MPELTPLISNTPMTKLIVGVVSTVLTIALGWAGRELVKISESTTRTLEDVEMFQMQQQAINNRVDRISQRVDSLFMSQLQKPGNDGTKEKP